MCKFIPLLLTLSLVGCGPLFTPMLQRPSAAEQKQLDGMWQNMIEPPNRVDRETLLGALTIYHLYENGVDRADFEAEKTVGSDRVVMSIHYQKESPLADAFYVTVYDVEGKVLRSERYTRADVDHMVSELTNQPHSTTEPLTRDEQDRADRFQKRMLAIQAATQPAGWRPPPTTAPKP